MTDRERLIEILSVPIYPRIGADPAEVVADYLLDNDVRPEVHAHWEMVEEKTVDYGVVRRTGRRIPMCTNCRRADLDYKTYFPRCPDCGAVMDEES